MREMVEIDWQATEEGMREYREAAARLRAEYERTGDQRYLHELNMRGACNSYRFRTVYVPDPPAPKPKSWWRRLFR